MAAGTPDIPVLIGVDGGGTACRLRLSCGGRHFEAVTGPGNLFTERSAALDRIHVQLAALARQAGLQASAIGNACMHLGLAGVLREEDRRRVAADMPTGRVTVSGDGLTTLIGATGGAEGAVVAIGTGSFAARLTGSGPCFVGGWGYELGDEASGAWLGRRMLAAALHLADGLAPESGWLRDLLAAEDGPEGIVTRFGGASPGKVAKLAPLVFAAAREKDAAALDAVKGGRSYILRALDRLGWREGEPLYLVGGVGPLYAPWLPRRMQAALAAPRGTALDGAMTLAAGLQAAAG